MVIDATKQAYAFESRFVDPAITGSRRTVECLSANVSSLMSQSPTMKFPWSCKRHARVGATHEWHIDIVQAFAMK